MRAAKLLGPGGPLAKAIAGYEHRPSQMAMADAVEAAIAHDGVLLVEAGTGTGKTWAYLVPALLSGRKVIVSTGTRTLQDQIMESDLPLLAKHLSVPVEAACMKGLGNYLCLRRYSEFRKSAAAATPRLARQLRVIDEWRETTPTGDRAELPLPEDAEAWSYVQSGSDTRIGPRCTFHDACFISRMRRRAQDAQIVVVNHHLFFADLALRGGGGGGVLPEYEVVIFDEAHQLEDIATLFFGTSVSTGMLERLARDAARALENVGGELRRADVLRTAAEEFFQRLPRPNAAREGGRVPLDRSVFTGELEERFFALDDALEALAAHCRLRVAESESMGPIARRAGELRDGLARIADGASSRAVPWVAPRGAGMAIGVSPVDVSSILEESLFQAADAVVLTSATLTTGGDFSFIKRRLGISFDVDELSLPSPFDFGEQAALYIPEHIPDPRSQAFAADASEEILSLVAITKGGAFVLCTSARMMHTLAEACRPTLVDRGHEVLVQGMAPKATLLERFRARGDAVLFATASFWEGIDVPGDALRLVIIDKLPFDVPTDPLVRARCERVQEQGGNAFMELLVPAAALALKQGFGRLLRSQRDRGLVAILDSRLVKKGYGRVFLRSLPPASRCYSREEAQAFWERGETS